MKSIKLFIYDLLDKSILKDEVKELRKKVKEYEEERKQLYNLCNVRLSQLRCKNLEIGRLKKQIANNK